MEMSVPRGRIACNYLQVTEAMKQKSKSGFLQDNPCFQEAPLNVSYPGAWLFVDRYFYLFVVVVVSLLCFSYCKV